MNIPLNNIKGLSKSNDNLKDEMSYSLPIVGNDDANVKIQIVEAYCDYSDESGEDYNMGARFAELLDEFSTTDFILGLWERMQEIEDKRGI